MNPKSLLFKPLSPFGGIFPFLSGLETTEAKEYEQANTSTLGLWDSGKKSGSSRLPQLSLRGTFCTLFPLNSNGFRLLPPLDHSYLPGRRASVQALAGFFCQPFAAGHPKGGGLHTNLGSAFYSKTPQRIVAFLLVSLQTTPKKGTIRNRRSCGEKSTQHGTLVSGRPKPAVCPS